MAYCANAVRQTKVAGSRQARREKGAAEAAPYATLQPQQMVSSSSLLAVIILTHNPLLQAMQATCRSTSRSPGALAAGRGSRGPNRYGGYTARMVVGWRSPFRICGKIWKQTDAMANPNPSPSTRFGAAAGNAQRAKQKGARDRLSAAFLTDFADDYESNGKAVIETVRGQDPIAYMRIAAALLPTKVEIAEDPITALSDEDLDHLRTLLAPDLPPEEKVRAIKARAAVRE
jgi:hypothetical protein